MNIERLFDLEGHRLKAFLERVNELGAFGGEVCEEADDYGWELLCDTWHATATFSDAYEYGDAEEPGQEANVTVFCCAQGGQILPGFVPYNYTSDVWCDLRNAEGQEELLTRLDALEDCAEEMVTAVKERLLELEVNGVTERGE